MIESCMDKETLIGFCRYYKGEDSNPYEGKDQSKAMFWFYESVWVRDTIEVSKDTKQEKEHDCFNYLNDYVRSGLSQFEMTDGVPATLKALLFNRYGHWMQGSVESFKEWYKGVYMGQSKG